MTRELWEALHGDEVDEPELTTLVSHFFAGGRMEPGADNVELTKEQGSGGEPALILHFHDGVLTDISAGPALTADDVAELCGRIEQSALASDELQVGRKIFFTMPEATGWWRYKDVFQLQPAPPEAPRPGMVMAAHPLVVELAYPKSDDYLVRIVRERFRSWELGLLLNLMLYGDVQAPGDRHPHHWVLDDEGEHLPKYLNEGYWFPGFEAIAAEFSPTDAVSPMDEIDDPVYYGRIGISVDQRLDVPKSLTELLDRYFSLPSPERMSVLRAAYWLRHARDVWDLSHTAYYLAVINAVEVMLPDPSGERCPTCGLIRGKGPTVLFEEFLDSHAPRTEETEPSRKELYRARSKMSHGRVLLRSDVPRAWGVLEPAEWEERDRSLAARNLAKTAILNWLRGSGTGG